MSRTLFALGFVVSSACIAAPEPGADEAAFVPPVGGKADNFFSTTTVELAMEGRTSVTLEPRFARMTEAERRARVEELIGLTHVSLAYFLTQYLIEKEPREAGHDWGGMGGIAKSGDYETADIRHEDGLTYSFMFRHVVAGPPDLLSHLPLEDGPRGTKRLRLRVGSPSNDELAQLETDHEWFRQEPWKGFDPARVPAERTRELLLTVREEDATDDAWFDYARLFEDGKLTMDVHCGWDYHSAYHRKHSRALYLWMKNELGWTSPIERFEDLTNTSGAFTTVIDANGTPITVEVRLFYGKTGGVNDPDTDAGGRVLDADLRRSLRESDVIVFSGHSGPFYGFSMANWKVTGEGDLSYREITEMELPRDRYQIVFADGCDTYQLGAAFARNPNKTGGRNVDVITTTSYSDATQPYSVMNFILHLTETGPDGGHRPRTMRSLVRDITAGSSMNPLYGVHFVDDNPHLHPYADLEDRCEPCDRHEDCGAPGNRCVQPRDGEGFCAPACTQTSECGRGYACLPIAAPTAHAIYEMGCVPRDYTCE